MYRSNLKYVLEEVRNTNVLLSSDSSSWVIYVGDRFKIWKLIDSLVLTTLFYQQPSVKLLAWAELIDASRPDKMLKKNEIRMILLLVLVSNLFGTAWAPYNVIWFYKFVHENLKQWWWFIHQRYSGTPGRIWIWWLLVCIHGNTLLPFIRYATEKNLISKYEVKKF